MIIGTSRLSPVHDYVATRLAQCGMVAETSPVVGAGMRRAISDADIAYPLGEPPLHQWLAELTAAQTRALLFAVIRRS